MCLFSERRCSLILGNFQLMCEKGVVPARRLHSQCWEMLLSPAGRVETTMVVAVEPSAFDSCDDTGLSVERRVRVSGAPEGAVVRWEVVSACDAPPEGGAAFSGTSGASPAGGGEDVALAGAASQRG